MLGDIGDKCMPDELSCSVVLLLCLSDLLKAGFQALVPRFTFETQSNRIIHALQKGLPTSMTRDEHSSLTRA